MYKSQNFGQTQCSMYLNKVLDNIKTKKEAKCKRITEEQLKESDDMFSTKRVKKTKSTTHN